MSTKAGPNKFDCYASAHPDEPMFILLGRDKNAPALVRQWAKERRAAGGDSEKIVEAEKVADEMEAWQRKLQLQMWEAHDTTLFSHGDF